jgi:uncharacterized protein
MSTTDSLLWTYLLTGLAIGFGHCIGMCGPLVVCFSLSLRGSKMIVPHLLYHCGRILTYILLGAAMGAGGSFTMVAANIRPVQVAVMFLAGALVMASGLAMGGWIPKVRIFNPGPSAGGLATAMFGRLCRARSAAVYLPAGLVLGLLPCGPVYTALLGTARAGMQAPGVFQGLLGGMALMAAFGLGTAPALLLVGKLAHTGLLKFRGTIYKAGAVLMIGLGFYFILAAVRY